MIKYANIKFFNKVSDLILKPTISLFVISVCVSLYYAFYGSPPDYQQGEMVRVMYIHVPFAWLALGAYCAIGVLSIFAITWKSIISYIYAQSLSHIGIVYTSLTLITGMLWGKPIWGAYWVWDARLTSMLILLIVYMGYISICNSTTLHRSMKPASVFAIIGIINIPIIKFSVNIWYSLHQGPSIFRTEGIGIDSSMLKPLVLMFITMTLLTITLFIIRTKTLIIRLKRHNRSLY